jgi:NADH-quinone oxidoreductase subunit G
MFLTETALLADVVLPSRTVYERDGTVVNLEGSFLPVRSSPVEAGNAEDFTGVVRYLGEALGERLEGRSVRSARRVMRKRFEADLADLPDYGSILRAKGRPAPRATTRQVPPASGNTLIVPSMARAEYLSRNPHLNAAVGGPKLRVNPVDAAERQLVDGSEVRLRVAGIWRHAVVSVTPDVPAGLMTLPTLPDQGVGLTQADLNSLVVDQVRLEVAS